MAGNKSAFAELLESVVIAVILATVIRFFLFQPFYIPSGSMEPTLSPGDRIIVNKLTYRFSEPNRGDVIVFKYPLDPQKDYIKRVVAVAGERVEIRNSEVYVNGEAIGEPYLPEGLVFNDFGPVEVPRDSYFVMGDNRNNSQDSRVWGALPEQNVIGKAVLVFWPLGRLGLIR
ncbi:signal peptidase I [Clostridiales bacterium PH28_bin88]|nr:signal peptidase I [Clostridiales bacterium PH28_bin88]